MKKDSVWKIINADFGMQKIGVKEYQVCCMMTRKTTESKCVITSLTRLLTASNFLRWTTNGYETKIFVYNPKTKSLIWLRLNNIRQSQRKIKFIKFFDVKNIGLTVNQLL